MKSNDVYFISAGELVMLPLKCWIHYSQSEVQQLLSSPQKHVLMRSILY